LSDIFADTEILIGNRWKISKRQEEMAAETDAVWKKYPKRKMSMSGHSLGGTTGILNAYRYLEEDRFEGMTAFNPGILFWMDKLDEYLSVEKIRYVVKIGDPVSNSLLCKVPKIINGTFLVGSEIRFGDGINFRRNHSIDDLLTNHTNFDQSKNLLNVQQSKIV